MFARSYGLSAIGLRYFNVFGRRQDPSGAYAAVIPRWTAALINGEDVVINGDGESSRDFCYVDNAVQANLLAAFADAASRDRVYNVAVGERTTLNQLYANLRASLTHLGIALAETGPVHGPMRAGDIRHSLASVKKAEELLGYSQPITLSQGLAIAMPWYVQLFAKGGHRVARTRWHSRHQQAGGEWMNSQFAEWRSRLPKIHPDHMRIARGAARISIFVLLGRCAGAFKEVAVAYRFGTSGIVDAYQLTLALVSWMPAAAMTIFGIVLIPVFVELRQQPLQAQAVFLASSRHGLSRSALGFRFCSFCVGHLQSTCLPEIFRQRRSIYVAICSPTWLRLAF